MLPDDCSDEDDYESYFLQPVNGYNSIAERVILANKELSEQISTDDYSEKPRRVTFREILEDYEPDYTESDFSGESCDIDEDINNNSVATTHTIFEKNKIDINDDEINEQVHDKSMTNQFDIQGDNEKIITNTNNMNEIIEEISKLNVKAVNKSSNENHFVDIQNEIEEENLNDSSDNDNVINTDDDDDGDDDDGDDNYDKDSINDDKEINSDDESLQNDQHQRKKTNNTNKINIKIDNDSITTYNSESESLSVSVIKIKDNEKDLNRKLSVNSKSKTIKKSNHNQLQKTDSKIKNNETSTNNADKSNQIDKKLLNIQLNYRSCCEYKYLNNEKLLPRYSGYTSQYGLSKEQLERRDMLGKTCHRKQLESQIRKFEDETSQSEINENAFAKWLHNKMKINKINGSTKNMYDCYNKRTFRQFNHHLQSMLHPYPYDDQFNNYYTPYK